MVIRNGNEEDFQKLVKLFQSFFDVHNLFQKSEEEIIVYLKDQLKKHELIVYEENGSLRGALFLIRKGQSSDGSHTLWKLRHFAYDSEAIASQLLDYAEKKIKASSKTSKIEVTIAETEKNKDFYLARGYLQEGVLANHYRWGEHCFILSKSFSQ